MDLARRYGAIELALAQIGGTPVASSDFPRGGCYPGAAPVWSLPVDAFGATIGQGSSVFAPHIAPHPRWAGGYAVIVGGVACGAISAEGVPCWFSVSVTMPSSSRTLLRLAPHDVIAVRDALAYTPWWPDTEDDTARVVQAVPEAAVAAVHATYTSLGAEAAGDVLQTLSGPLWVPALGVR